MKLNGLAKKIENGFTLIELLVAIAIIGVLASLLMVNFVAVRERARDAERKSNLRQIQSALELYRSDHGLYPDGLLSYTPGCERAILSDPTDCSSPMYMRSVPSDSNNPYNLGEFYYESLDEGTSYVLAACLENVSDSTSDVYSITEAEGFGVDTGDCASEKFYILQSP